MMDYKKAIETLRPMADNYVLPGVVDALETAIRAMEDLPRVKEELAEWQHRFEKYADYSVQRDKMIEQMKEVLHGDCDVCVNETAIRNCVCDEPFIPCSECYRECACKDCEKGSKWEWRGVVEYEEGDANG